MPTHIFHYNVHSEQKYFLGNHRDLYDLVALNGNIVSHTPAGIAAFIATSGKPFYIDPQTHIFQHSTNHLKNDISDKEKGEPRKLKFKPSIKKLAEDNLGSPFTKVIENDTPLTPDIFYNDAEINIPLITEMCNNVINFQNNILINSLDEEEREFIEGDNNFQPQFILSPYFYLSPTRYKEWLEITLKAYEITKSISTDKPTYLNLVLSKEALYDDLDYLCDKIGECSPDGVLLWVDDHQEEILYKSQIGSYINLLRKLRDITPILYNTHGGYLSILLCHSEIALLNGVGHSVNYGESRSVVPVGGGIPMARFYFPSIHSRLRFAEASDIIFKKNWFSSQVIYTTKVCSCLQCAKLIRDLGDVEKAYLVYGTGYPVTFKRRTGTIVSLEYPSKEAKEAAACHYIYNKSHEFIELNKPLRELLSNLAITYDEIKNINEDLIAHIKNWELALTP